MVENDNITPNENIAPIPTTTYQGEPQLLKALDWLLSAPSIPIALRKQFYALWENTIFGNYEEKDIKFLMSKFREWCILLKWFIPEQRWGNQLSYADPDSLIEVNYDLNTLLNNLESLYFINLTRGRDGFTVKEMTTVRSVYNTQEEPKKKRGIHLF